MLNLLFVLAMASEPTTQLCASLGDGHYACPSEGGVLEARDMALGITIHVRSTASSGDGWECGAGWCSFDYGLVVDDDDLPLPGEGPQCDEAAQDSCEPPPPSQGGVVKPPVKVVIRGCSSTGHCL